MSGLVAVVLSALAGMGIPWDVGGRVPPDRTRPASRPDPLCRQSYANDRPRGGPRLRFGIGPRLAGESGAAQTAPVVREDPARRDVALRRLRGGGFLAVRLNRLFLSDGRRGIARFVRLARHYATWASTSSSRSATTRAATGTATSARGSPSCAGSSGPSCPTATWRA